MNKMRQLITKAKKHKVFAGFIIFDILVILVLIIVLIINLFKTVTIEINVAPADATVKIGNSTYQNGVYKILPTSGTVEISCDGFQTKSFKVNLGTNNYLKVEDYLIPNDGNLDYYIKTGNDEDLQLLREVNNDIPDEKVTDFLNSYDKKAAIINELPMMVQTYSAANSNGVFFNISNNNGQNCTYINLCLLVSPMVNVTEDDIKEYITEKGYNPDDYQIEYKKDIEL